LPVVQELFNTLRSPDPTQNIDAFTSDLENKIEVPESLAILGHDGLDVTQMVYPKITTIVQQRYEMGHLSADYLLNFVNDGQETGDMILPVTIQKGQTV